MTEYVKFTHLRSDTLIMESSRQIFFGRSSGQIIRPMNFHRRSPHVVDISKPKKFFFFSPLITEILTILVLYVWG